MTEERILVLRPDHIGDMVLFSGALSHLRSLYPSASITLAVGGAVRNLIERCPHIDGIVPWETMVPNWSRLAWRLLEYPRIRYALRECRGAFLSSGSGRRWDRVIVPVRSPSEELLWFVRHSGIPRSIGIAGCDANLFGSRYRPETTYTTSLVLDSEALERHELETTRRFLSFLPGCRDLSIGEIFPEFWTADEDRRFAEQVVPRCAEGDEGAIALVPGAGSRYREWPLPNFAEVVAGLSFPGGIVILGGPTDTEKAERLCGLLRGSGLERPVATLAGKTTLRQTVEVIRRCRLLIGSETAALHIATALGIPTVGILGGGHFGRFYPWGNPAIHRVAASPMDCVGCGWRCVFGDFRCIPAVTPRMVAEEILFAVRTS